MAEGPRRPRPGRELDDNIESEVDERSASKLISLAVETTAGSYFQIHLNLALTELPVMEICL